LPEFLDFRHVISGFMLSIAALTKYDWNEELTTVSNVDKLDAFAQKSMKGTVIVRQLQEGKNFYEIFHRSINSCRTSIQYSHGIQNFESFKAIEPIMQELQAALENLMTEKGIPIPAYRHR
jgi:hypothetical protein